MIGGALAVMAWFYFANTLKPQKFCIEIQGNNAYDRDFIDEK